MLSYKTIRKQLAHASEDQKPQQYFQLAEYYRKKSVDTEFKAHRYDTYRGRPEWTGKALEQKKTLAKAKSYRAQAISIYQKLIRVSPHFDKLCRVRSILATQFSKMEQLEAQRKVLRELVRIHRYPTCPFVPSAYLSIGELNFTKRRFHLAQKAYQKALLFPHLKFKGYLLYKLAWCEYKQGHIQGSITWFQKALRYSHSKNASFKSQANRLSFQKIVQRELRQLSNTMKRP